MNIFTKMIAAISLLGIVSCSSKENKVLKSAKEFDLQASEASQLLVNLKTLKLELAKPSNSSDITPDSNGVIYIKTNGNWNGSSWDKAASVSVLRNLTNLRSDVKSIWIASGVYTPADYNDVTPDLTKSFQLKSGVSIYGGFYGNENNLADRDINSFPVVLCGRLDTKDSCNSGKYQSYKVVTISDIPTAALDGVVIMGGNSNNQNSGKGGAININNSSPLLSNLVIADNQAVYGGAVYIGSQYGTNPIYLQNLYLSNNSAVYGGAINNSSAKVVIENSSFVNNKAQGYGGSIYNRGTLSLSVANFYSNQASSGGAIYNENSIITRYVTFDSNNASQGGAIYQSSNSNNAILNSLFINNKASTGSSLSNAYNTTLLINNIFWDGTTAVNGTINGSSYYNLFQGANTQNADSSGNLKYNGNFTDIFDSSSNINSPVSYYPIKGLPINKGVMIWATVDGKFYLFPPYYTASPENLANSNYTEFTFNGTSITKSEFKSLPASASELTKTDVRGFWRENDQLPDLGPFELSATSRYYLDPSLFGYESISNSLDKYNVSPNGGIYSTQPAFIKNIKGYLSSGLYYADPRQSLTKNKWRVSYSQTIDEPYVYDASTAVTGIYQNPSDACYYGWDKIKNIVYNGWLSSKYARFNYRRGVCEILESNGYIFTNFAIRTGQGYPYKDTHILTNADGRYILFEKSDTSPGTFFTKSSSDLNLSSIKIDSSLSGLMPNNTGWNLNLYDTNLKFDSNNRLVLLQDATDHITSIKYRNIPSNDQEANRYYTNLGLKPILEATVTAYINSGCITLRACSTNISGDATGSMRLLFGSNSRVIMMKSLETPLTSPYLDLPDLYRIYFHYNNQGLVDYMSPVSKADGDAIDGNDSINNTIYQIKYNAENRLSYLFTPIDSDAFVYDAGKPTSYQNMSKDIGKDKFDLQQKIIYSNNDKKLTIRDNNTGILYKELIYDFKTEQLKTTSIKQKAIDGSNTFNLTSIKYNVLGDIDVTNNVASDIKIGNWAIEASQDLRILNNYASITPTFDTPSMPMQSDFGFGSKITDNLKHAIDWFTQPHTPQIPQGSAVELCSNNTYIYIWEEAAYETEPGVPTAKQSRRVYDTLKSFCSASILAHALENKNPGYNADDHIFHYEQSEYPDNTEHTKANDKIIFIGHGWGAHSAILTTHKFGNQNPDIIITLDPVVKAGYYPTEIFDGLRKDPRKILENTWKYATGEIQFIADTIIFPAMQGRFDLLVDKDVWKAAIGYTAINAAKLILGNYSYLALLAGIDVKLRENLSADVKTKLNTLRTSIQDASKTVGVLITTLDYSTQDLFDVNNDAFNKLNDISKTIDNVNKELSDINSKLSSAVGSAADALGRSVSGIGSSATDTINKGIHSICGSFCGDSPITFPPINWPINVKDIWTPSGGAQDAGQYLLSRPVLPNFNQAWISYRATVRGKDGDTNPIGGAMKLQKVCILVCSVSFSLDLPEFGNGWNRSDYLAFTGGKYGDFPGWQHAYYKKAEYHHDDVAKLLIDSLILGKDKNQLMFDDKLLTCLKDSLHDFNENKHAGISESCK